MRDLYDVSENRAKYKQTMSPEALVFLEDALARRLAVAWPACHGVEDMWFDAAGIAATTEAMRVSRALRMNGICRDNGVTDPLALQYVAALVTEPIKKLGRARGNQNRRR